MKNLMLLLLFSLSLSASSITTSEAINYIGSKKTVCGKVVSTYYARNSNGSPTFLNFDRPYPNQVFTAVIFGDYRADFGSNPEDTYLFKDICVSGKIDEYNGIPQILLRSKSQVK